TVEDIVRCGLALRELQRIGRRVDQRRAPSARLQAGDRESAGVRERIEHFGVARVRGDALAVALLVEIGPRLLPARDVDDEPDTAGGDRELRRRLFAGEQPTPRRQALFVARPALRALVDAARVAELH